ncbi:MAG: hypothetical protein FWD46_08355 [Cystobacterineae bacterium]|nr:hypothetical protein [Cystobacterineae bacterium]
MLGLLGGEDLALGAPLLGGALVLPEGEDLVLGAGVFRDGCMRALF